MSSFDQEIMARTAVGEARGEGDEGMQAVMWTGVNRYTARKWFSGQTIAGTFLKKEQFSCWNPDDPNYSLICNISPDIGVFFNALKWASAVIAGVIIDPTLGSTHYKRVGTPAAWAEGQTPVITIGNHEFYKGIA